MESDHFGEKLSLHTCDSLNGNSSQADVRSPWSVCSHSLELCVCARSLILSLSIKFSIFGGSCCSPFAYNALIFFLFTYFPLYIHCCPCQPVEIYLTGVSYFSRAPFNARFTDWQSHSALEFSVARRKPSLSLVPGDAFSEVWEAGIWAGGAFPGWTWSIQTAVVVTGLCTDPGQAAFEETFEDHLVKPLFPPGGFVADFVRLRSCRDGKTSLLSRSEKPVQSSIPYFAFILTTVEYCRVKGHNSVYWRITGQCLLWSLF